MKKFIIVKTNNCRNTWYHRVLETTSVYLFIAVVYRRPNQDLAGELELFHTSDYLTALSMAQNYNP